MLQPLHKRGHLGPPTIVRSVHRIGDLPVAVAPAVYIGSFMDPPAGHANEPVAVALALHIRTFLYSPCWEANGPVTVQLAVLQTPFSLQGLSNVT